MALWGKTGAATKPGTSKYAKREVYANTKGWVQPAQGNGNASAQEEVLVCIKGLSSAVSATTGTGLAQANITSINWNITTFDKSDGGTLSATVNWDENVTVTGSPTLAVAGTGGRNHSLVYSSGSTTNRLTFILAIGAANAATNADDELTFGANPLAHAGGSTIVDSLGGGNSVITSAAGIGTSAGTITVVA
jgi:hypothetical protein